MSQKMPEIKVKGEKKQKPGFGSVSGISLRAY